jgi:hypothetical protein
LADNAKHNQTGRVDENGAIQHRQVEHCPVNGFSLNMFAHFHILRQEVPGFAPDFNDPKYGEYRYCEWYDYCVFYAKDIRSEMSYDSMCFQPIVQLMPDLTAPTDHHARVSLIHLKNDISISKVTHAGRCYAAQTARAHGATVNGTKALGGWNESGAFRNCYDRAFPVDALLGAAGFNARQPEQYCLPRSTLGKISCCILSIFLMILTESLEPPTELLQQLFPWWNPSLRPSVFGHRITGARRISLSDSS